MLWRRKDAYGIRVLSDGCSFSRRFTTILLIVLCAGVFSPQQDGRHVCVLASTISALRTDAVLPSETETTESANNIEPQQTTTVTPVVTALDQTGSELEQTGSTASPQMPATAIPPTGDVTVSGGGGVGGEMTSLQPEVLTTSSQNVTGNTTPPGASTEPGNSVVQPMQSDSPVGPEVSEAATHAPSSTNVVFVPQTTTAVEAETGMPPGVTVSNTVEPSTAGTVSLVSPNVETISPQTALAGNAGTGTAEVELAPTTERIQNPTEMLSSEAATAGVQLTTAQPVGTETMTSSTPLPSTMTNLMSAFATTGVETGESTTAVEVGALWTDTTTRPAVTTTVANAAATSSSSLTPEAEHTVVSHSSISVDESSTTLLPAEVSDAAETPAGLLTVEQTIVANSSASTVTVAIPTPSPSSAAASTATASSDVTTGPSGATSSFAPAVEAGIASTTVAPPSESRQSTESTTAVRQQTAVENLITVVLTQADANLDLSTAAAFQTSTTTTSNVSLPGDQTTTPPPQIVDQSPTPQAQKSASDSGLSGGEIAAIVVCSVVGGIALIVVLMFFIQRRLFKRSRQRYEFSNSNEIEMRSSY